MQSGRGKIVLMGSGELTATMVEVHKSLLGQLEGTPQVAFLDTPAGFQLNVDQISQKAAEYFRKRVLRPLAVSSFKSREDITDFEAEKAFSVLRESDYILIGPGSPTYAVEQWSGSPVPDIFAKCVNRGGCLVAASAAALTVGRYTLPVYEIYKVGQRPHWVDGVDILGKFGLNLVVVPHWNNAEGGNHDTRFCFMGEPRFKQLVELLADKVPVFGLDEHTACIFNLETDEAEVKGIGTVTFRKDNHEINFKSGDRFPIDIIRGRVVDSGWDSTAARVPTTHKSNDSRQDDFWDRIHTLEENFHRGLSSFDARESINALLELDRRIWQAQADLENEEFITQARDTFRELIVLLGTELASTPKNGIDCPAPLVDELIELRQQFRDSKKWAEADSIRNILYQVNILVEDAKNGSRWLPVEKSERLT